MRRRTSGEGSGGGRQGREDEEDLRQDEEDVKGGRTRRTSGEG